MSRLLKIWSFTPIQVKFLSIVIPLVLICLVGTVVIMGSIAREHALNRENETFRKIGLATADALGEAFWNYNLSQTDAIMQSLNLIPNLIASEALELENGDVLADSALNRLVSVAGNTGNYAYTQTYPIVYQNNDGTNILLGSFELTYSLQGLEVDTQRQFVTAVIASLFGALALIVGTTLTLSRFVLRPIEAVARSSRGTAQTTLAANQENFVPIIWNTHDQVGTLVRDYNLLRERQKQYSMALSEQKARRALENERQRITMELHDGLGGTLVSLLARIENAPDIKRDAVTIQLRESIHELGAIMDMLESDGDIDMVLAQIRRRTEPMFDDFGATLTWKVINTLCVPEPGPRTAGHLARIVQEAITNALRHSQATDVCLHMTKETLMISDNGHGIATDHKKGRGLQTMQTRAKKIGLTFEIQTGDDGTTILLKNAGF